MIHLNSSNNAKKITDNVCRFIIGSNLKLITAPLIREIVNVELLKLGLEKQRLQYTRIGFPYYDLEKMTNKSFDMNLVQKIFKHVINEYVEVKKLIENRKKKSKKY